MNHTMLITNDTITVKEAHEAAHAAASTLFDQLSGYTYLTGAAGYPAFQSSAEDALLAFLLNRNWAELGREDDELLAEQTVSVNVQRQEDGELLYEVGFDIEGSDYGTNCKVKDLATLNEWFDEEWIDVE
ncbi:hypothetical protein D7T48_00780 [Stenotrophomonas maltophilia]|uniref:hypothetical protein n=1 Tax=Stenotrophomonas maltophilia TaxID=40324 RepID=UPI00130FE1DC|nr:hypothetical protein [Stenotrophomonas maltophilia]MBA0276060.1 hypothetical protein [Stenotrophomonas maltophilia]MBA0411259.1 hypothetical protein [Stenotrophomonas maltophilia]MBA0496362.1 hypothetical protein [Stenotrophomonas maltophilia]MBA0500644.1 hypothetical protein [Stenotrophomonas maltophilia]MBA0505796.1 hypothetical protein [Stenotrophomonas maltophilia]